MQKEKNNFNEKFPSYGPIVKLKRVGYRGTPLYIFKLRTMYPYSEFIQGDLYEKNHLDVSGKMKDDYRITSWEKFLEDILLMNCHKYIIGLMETLTLLELGNKEQYFNLYPKDIQHKRIKFKPGLIPPYYADLPKSFEEIIESEKTYLNQKRSRLFTLI